jgi:putative ubiquitin-RnfH superfamily antitoxin RatB of RatAB toxin-antitoxin module
MASGPKAVPTAGGPWVDVVWSQGPRQWQQQRVDWVPGLTAAQAVVACPWPVDDAQQLREQLAQGTLRLAIWNKAVSPQRPMQPGDRVELLRGLRVDPKVARRERFQAQGSRAAGLFGRTRRPPGAR